MLEDYSDMMDFFFLMENAPHASVHGGLGGAYGCDMFLPLLDAGYVTDEKAVKSLCKTWIFTLKALYRENMITAPTDCTVGSSVQDATCPFECVASTKDLLRDSISTGLVKGFTPPLDDDGIDAWEDFICGGDASRVFAGDHSESASPSDPSFWPIHPTLERLFHAKMIAGGFESTSWRNGDDDSEFVCIRQSCYINSTKDYYDECCYGHKEDDQMYNFIDGDRNSYWGPTNGEVVASTDPTSSEYSVNYIYDNFEWSHCSEDFSGLLSDLYEAAQRRR
jgi:hypothetical protein